MTTTLSFTSGNDSYTVGGAGAFNLSFLAGDDRLSVNGGTFTTAHMGIGNDVVAFHAGDASVFGEGGNDRFEIYVAGIQADGGDGADLFNFHGGGNETVHGRAGDDRFTFYAPGAGMRVHGEAGDDSFDGRGQILSGSFYGGVGDDHFAGFASLGGNVVLLYGGPGNDTYRLDATNPAFFVENAGEGTDTVKVPMGISYVLPPNFENLLAGGYAGSTLDAASLAGNALDNRITGTDNVGETIHGYAGNDTLLGLGSEDTIYGGAGNDRIDGGEGADTLSGDDGNDKLTGGFHNDTLFGGLGNDVLDGGPAIDTMDGGSGNDLYLVDNMADQIAEFTNQGTDSVRVDLHLLNQDHYTLPDNVENGYLMSPGTELFDNGLDNLLVGTESGDALIADLGNDTLRGLGGDDFLKAGSGNNSIDAGDGDDSLFCGNGDDVLIGGLGQDYFVTSGGSDVIVYNQTFDALFDSTGRPNDQADDFDVQFDKISLIAIDADATIVGKQAFHFTGTTRDHLPGDVWVASDGTVDGYYLYAEVDGDEFADMAIHLILPGGGGSFTESNLIGI